MAKSSHNMDFFTPELRYPEKAAADLEFLAELTGLSIPGYDLTAVPCGRDGCYELVASPPRGDLLGEVRCAYCHARAES